MSIEIHFKLNPAGNEDVVHECLECHFRRGSLHDMHINVDKLKLNGPYLYLPRSISKNLIPDGWTVLKKRSTSYYTSVTLIVQSQNKHKKD